MVERILESLGGYYLLGGAGFLIGSVLVLRNYTKAGLSFPLALAVWTAGIYGGLVGSRILFVLGTDPGLFKANLPLAFVFWQGHLSWQGGPVLGSLAALLVLLTARRPIWSNLGCSAPGLALCHAFARVSCLVQGCCYGAATTVPWAIYSHRLGQHVHPTQVYSMACELVVAALLQFLWREPSRRKYLMPLYWLLLGGHRFVTEAFRGTSAGPELIPGLRFYQSTSLLLIALALCLLAYLRKRRLGLAVTPVVMAVMSGLILMPRSVQPGELPGQVASGARGRYLVLCRAMFEGELRPWTTMREQQGYEMEIGSWEATPSEQDMRAWVAEHAETQCAAILIVGDCAQESASESPWHMPSCRSEAQPADGDGGDPADALLGDLDGDRIPDVPVGRMPVRSRADLQAQIKKLDRHAGRVPGPEWPRAIIWTGNASDQEGMHALTLALRDMLPSWMKTFILSAWPESPYYGDPLKQPEVFLDQLGRPACIAVVAGHGSEQSARMGSDGGEEIFLAWDDARRLAATEPPGPLVLLACRSGNFAGKEQPCLAEAFWNHRSGPAAVIGTSARVMPETNSLAAYALIDALCGKPRTVGELLFAMQQTLCRGMRLDVLREALHTSKKASAEEVNQEDLAREALTYGILGDPAAELLFPAASGEPAGDS